MFRGCKCPSPNTLRAALCPAATVCRSSKSPVRVTLRTVNEVTVRSRAPLCLVSSVEREGAPLPGRTRVPHRRIEHRRRTTTRCARGLKVQRSRSAEQRRKQTRRDDKFKSRISGQERKRQEKCRIAARDGMYIGVGGGSVPDIDSHKKLTKVVHT